MYFSLHFFLSCLKIVAVLIWSCCWVDLVQAATLRVPTQYPTIQGALNAAQNGDTVLVQPGEYLGVRLSFGGKAIRLKSASGPAVTTIRGDGANSVFFLTRGETRKTIIEGFTITGGGGPYGGAISLNGSSPIVRGNIITGNHVTRISQGAGGGGGGIRVVNRPANPLIVDNTFRGNEAQIAGGAIYLHVNAAAKILRNTFVDNHARQGGGGAIRLARDSSITILANHFTDNTATAAGGAISVFTANAVITGNVIANNDGGVFAGGIHFETQNAYGSRSLVVRNNRIEGNTAINKGGGIHTFTENTNSPIEITNNVIIGNRCVNPACVSAQSLCGLGGGISNFRGTGKMVVRGNLIRDNVADLQGAAVFSSMPLTFTENQVINNQSRWRQPGVSVEGTSTTQITRNVFRGNHFLAGGGEATALSPGGMLVRGFTGDALIESNVFIENQGTRVGALLVHAGDGSQARIVGNTFAGNQLQEPKYVGGGAVWLQDNGEICNNTFTDNDIYGIRIKRVGNPPSLVSVNYNHFYGNSSGVLFDATGYMTVGALNGTPFAANNIAGDPVFVNDGSYRLSDTSPLVDQANLACFVIAADVQGEPRLQPPDIGADELSDRDPFTVGLFRSDLSRFYLRNSNTSGAADISFRYGTAGANWIPLTGDWDGDGIVSVGLFDPTTSTFSLRNSNTAGAANLVFKFGPPDSGWIPLAGDWDGNKVTTVGFYLPEAGQFRLRNSNTAGIAESVFNFGPRNAHWLPLVGDWNGDGRQTIGLYRPTTGAFYLRNANTAGSTDIKITFGQANAGWLPITGDWNGDQIFSLGLYRPSTSTFYLRNSNTTGGADFAFNYGPAGLGWTPLAGQWDGM